MQPSDLCPWCHQHPDTNARDGGGASCCEQAQDAEAATEALEASDTPDERLVQAAVVYWPDLAADLAVMRQPVSHRRHIVGTEQMNHTTIGARRAA